MNKTTLFPILLVLLAACDKMDISPIQADSFIKFYNTYPVVTGVDVKEIPGQGYAVIGTVKSYTQGSQICLIRTDLYGNWIDSARYFGRNLDDEAFCLQVLHDKGLAILGSSVSPETEKKEVYFIRTDSLGNEIWTQTIKGTGNVEAYHFEVSASENFIMTGYGDTLRPGGAVSKDIWLFGLDPNGNPISNWRKPRYIGGLKDDVGTHLQILNNGNIIVTGQTRSDPRDVTEKKYSHAFVLQTNSIGLGSYLVTMPSSGDEVGNCIRAMGNNSYLVLGVTKVNTAGAGTDVMLKKVTVTDTLHVDWEKTFGDVGDDLAASLIPDNNSLHLLVTYSADAINSSITLITTSPDGDNPVFSHFGEGVHLVSSSFVKTSDNGFIITGTNKFTDNDMSMTLIKLKSDGTL